MRRAGGGMSSVKPIPEGYHNLQPYLYICGACAAVEFYKKAFNARVTVNMPGPNGRVAGAENPLGFGWYMITHVRDLSHKAMNAAMSEPKPA
jgi:PhnB protein